jgi:hypothetical protein
MLSLIELDRFLVLGEDFVRGVVIRAPRGLRATFGARAVQSDPPWPALW